MIDWREELETLHEQLVGQMTDGTHVLRVVEEGKWWLQHPLRCRPDLLGCPVNQMLMRGFLVADEDGEYVADLGEEVRPGLYRLTMDATQVDYAEPHTGRWVVHTDPTDPVTVGLEDTLRAIERLVRLAEDGQ